MDTITQTEPPFAAQFAAYYDTMGRVKVAQICDISIRTAQNWRHGAIVPSKSQQAGALMLLGCFESQEARDATQSRIAATMADLPPYDPETLRSAPITWPCNPTIT